MLIWERLVRLHGSLHSPLMQRTRQIIESLNEKTLQENNCDPDYERRQIKSPRNNRHYPAHSIQNRYRRIEHETNNRIVRIRIHPRDDNPSDNTPHVGPRYILQYVRDGNDEISDDIHI